MNVPVTMRPRCGHWPGPGSPAAAPVASGPQHYTLSLQQGNSWSPVTGVLTMRSAQYIEEEEWRSENCVMVTCMKKICSLKVFSKVPFMILSLYNKKLIHHMITVKEIMILDV